MTDMNDMHTFLNKMECMIYLLSYVVMIVGSAEDVAVLSVLHINDGHTHIEHEKDIPIDNEASFLLKEMPNIIDIIRWSKTIDNKNKIETLVLNTGSFTGSPWNKNYNNKIVELFNKMRIDFSSFGHFGFSYNNINETEEFLKTLDFPVLCSNIENTKIDGVNPTHTISLNGGSMKLGLIGYFTPHDDSEITFTKETVAIRREVKILRDSGVKTVIAFGHSGQGYETNFGMNIKEVDMFIGGHSTKFFGGENIMKYYPIWMLSQEEQGHERRFKSLTVEGTVKHLYVTKFILKINTSTGNIAAAQPVPIPTDIEVLIKMQDASREAMLTGIDASGEMDDKNKTGKLMKKIRALTRNQANLTHPILLLNMFLYFIINY